MSFHSCEECGISTPRYLMYDGGICIQCAKELGVFQQPDNHGEVERVQAEQVRVAQENQEAFDKEKEARRELAERELCRRRLLPFVMRVEPDYMPGWLHADICSRLEKFTEDIQAGKNPRLMITVPPRHGKSALASKTFPSWYLGKFPTHEIMLCSYSGDLAEDFSRKCRNLIENPDYKSIFPNTKLSPSTKSVKHWMTTDDGGCVAAGVGGH